MCFERLSVGSPAVKVMQGAHASAGVEAGIEAATGGAQFGCIAGSGAQGQLLVLNKPVLQRKPWHTAKMAAIVGHKWHIAAQGGGRDL